MKPQLAPLSRAPRPSQMESVRPSSVPSPGLQMHLVRGPGPLGVASTPGSKEKVGGLGMSTPNVGYRGLGVGATASLSTAAPSSSLLSTPSL